MTKNGSGLPVTDGLAIPLLAVTCVARGPFSANHIYACGANGVLYETDYNHAFPILNWRVVDQDVMSGVPGSIWALCVMVEPVKLIVASDGGLFWAEPPLAGATIRWAWVSGLPTLTFSDVVNADGKRIAAAANGDGKVAGVFMLRWDSQQKAIVPDPPHPTFANALILSMRRTHLASSPKDFYRTIYLAAGGDDDKLAALMRSDDGAKTFASVPSVPHMTDSQANRNLGIGCSPHDPQTVAVGMRRGPWISTDGGKNWTEHGDAGSGSGKSVHLHPDMYFAVFDEGDPTSQTLWITSDGGVVWTEDLGTTWNSLSNRSLANLEINQTAQKALAVSQVMWSYGEPNEDGPIEEVDLGLVIPDLIAISTQDNGVLGFQGQALDGWVDVDVALSGGDGRSLDFLASGELVWGLNDTAGFRVTSWSGAGFGPTRSLGSRPAASADGDPIVSAVRDARVINDDGERLWAFSVEPISINRQALWALWSPDGHAGWHWDAVKWPLGPYYSLSSANGRRLYLAGAGGIDRINPKTGVLTSLSVATPQPPWDFAQVVAVDDRRAIAIHNKGGSGYVIENAPAAGPIVRLSDWVELTPLPGRPQLQSVEVDVDSAPLRMWVATKGEGYDPPSRVYETRDGGSSWHELTGLPPVIASSLRLGPEISTSERYLYLATWGRSIYQTNVA